ncbi:hypothetical protein THRCLA_08496 [Thraustotheca clavata]|uniref:DUF676 domain-containing protein n=1 Tax=Thraustotheca clavata TaxID=74557 RepID=A0A1V9Z5M8_9STRA|nr:hypothetical protein THRCLA_08496 [Thraustotheca clavata]
MSYVNYTLKCALLTALTMADTSKTECLPSPSSNEEESDLFGAPPAARDSEYMDLFGASPAPKITEYSEKSEDLPATVTLTASLTAEIDEDEDPSSLFGPPPTTPIEADVTHLVVLQHGLHGSPRDYHTFEFILKQVFANEPGLCIVAAQSNATESMLTHDGIDAGGIRLANEIESIAALCPKLEKISLIGHSLGGLYVRYCIGVLYGRRFFDRYKPLNVITLATPHLGIRVPFKRGSLNAVVNTLSSKLLDRIRDVFRSTGAQFVLQDQATPQTIDLAHPNIAIDPPPFQDATGKFEIQLPEPNDGYCMLFYRLHAKHLSVYFSDIDEDTLFEFDLTGYEAILFVPTPPSTIETEANQFIDPFESATNDTVLQLKGFHHGEKMDIEIRIETNVDWALCHALLLRLGSLRCVNYCGDKSRVRGTILTPRPIPSLLQCLAQGCFLWGYSLFKRRSLYSNIFFDIQVPYSCGSIRSYNPYKNNAATCATSPFYPHITLNSLSNAAFLRDTLPKQKWSEMDVYPVFKSAPSKSRFNGWANYGQYLFQSNKSASPASSPSSSYVNAPQSPSSHSASVDSPRADESNQVIVDNPEEAFVDDPLQDVLRGMLMNLQALPYERIDVIFDGVLGHERIIAKRHTAFTPNESGVDVVHHIADTLLL